MINLDTPLIELLQGVQLRNGQRVGIELEYEHFAKEKLLETDLVINKWYLADDPSLRAGGMELISQVLLPGTISSALDEARQVIQKSGARSHMRCGIHVHLNMTDVTIKQLWNLLVLYVLAEPSIFKQYADGRETSHFCVPLWCNAAFAQTMYTDINMLRVGIENNKRPQKRAIQFDLEQPIEADEIQALVAGQLRGRGIREPKRNRQLGIFSCIKYSALNLRPLISLGSIEFRQHPATTDMNKVRKWIDFLMHLRTVATGYDDPLTILDDYERGGLYALVEKLGLEHNDVDEIDQEEALDVATMAAGHLPVPWEKLTWEMD